MTCRFLPIPSCKLGLLLIPVLTIIIPGGATEVGIGNRSSSSGMQVGIFTLDLLDCIKPVCPPTTSNLTVFECESYTSPGGKFLNSTGIYMDTIPNAAGCDSIITIDLTIAFNSSAVISVSECEFYTSPSGEFIWTQSGTYPDTISNAAGCDSILIINLDLEFNSTSSISVSECEFYTSPSGEFTWTQSGMYMDTISNAAGCDSIITIDLSLEFNSTSSINVSECESYTSPSGEFTWTQSGTYMDTISNAAGCDSILTIALTIDSVNTGVTQNGSMLTSDAADAMYQWLDCDNDSTPISGETNRSFIPSENGNYAVLVTANSCQEMSACINVANVGIDEAFNKSISVFPNPGEGRVHIELIGNEPSWQVRITDQTGRILSRKDVFRSNKIEVDLGPSSGIYFIEIQTKDGKRALKKLIRL